jgi:pimeloyl-ACP methyl ester carboxylesterase
MCGAATPDRSYAWDTTDAPLRARSPLWFTYGDKDFLVPEVEGAIRALSGLGFAITEKVVPGAGHCTFDAHAEAMRIWTANR